MSSSEPAISVQALHKRYEALETLREISFEVGAGEIFGILGPNGAGKTTLIEILEGIRMADGGRVRVLGADPSSQSRKRRARIGVCMQSTALPQLLTVEELLRLYSAFYPHPLSIHEILGVLELDDKRKSLTRTLSGGQLQRLSIALMIIGDPDLIFLDEPTSELDPYARRAVWNLLYRQRDRGRTILLTTHQMEEAEQFCNRVAILDHGTVLDLDTPSALISKYCPGNVIRFRTSSTFDIASYDGVLQVDPLDSKRATVVIKTGTLETVLQSLMAGRSANSFTLDRLEVQGANLEDVFLYLTGRRVNS